MAEFRFPEFRERPPWLGPHLQTVRSRAFSLGRSPALRHVERVELPLADGTGDRLSASLHRPDAESSGVLAMLVHGLGGDEDSGLLLRGAAHLLACGHSVLRISLRGVGRSQPLCSAPYHAAGSEDLRAAVRAAQQLAVAKRGFLVGYSLGGNLVLKCLAEVSTARTDPVSGWLLGGASVSAPIELASASRRLAEWSNCLYQAYLLRALKRQWQAWPLPEWIERAATRARSLWEFDERVIAPFHGFGSIADYYASASSRGIMHRVRLPTLVIAALDDPLVPAQDYTCFPWARAPSLHPLLPGAGGHCGFHARGIRVGWHDVCVALFLDVLRDAASKEPAL